jgi:hypothetical protein
MIKQGDQMINYQGAKVTIYAISKTDPTRVKVKYENHIHHAGCGERDHCGLSEVAVSDLHVQDFNTKEELANAIQKSPFYFDKNGLHINDFPPEVEVKEDSVQAVKIDQDNAKTVKELKASKYHVDLEKVKEMLSKGCKKSFICKKFSVPFWYLDKVLKANNINQEEK